MKKLFLVLVAIAMFGIVYSCGKDNAPGDTEGAELINKINDTANSGDKDDEEDKN